MDVYGNNPTSSKGEYFRNSAWYWRPLVEYIIKEIPWTNDRDVSWHTNDGTGLDANDSLILAQELKKRLDSGEAATYAKLYTAEIQGLPRVPCEICGATGRRQQAPRIGPGSYGCNGCGGDYATGASGTGQREDWRAAYPFSLENLREFVEFLTDCGGFRIC